MFYKVRILEKNHWQNNRGDRIDWAGEKVGNVCPYPLSGSASSIGFDTPDNHENKLVGFMKPAGVCCKVRNEKRSHRCRCEVRQKFSDGINDPEKKNHTPGSTQILG